ncbi:hypothetical protein ACU686_35870 [Yinghuangia aomiensis]
MCAAARAFSPGIPPGHPRRAARARRRGARRKTAGHRTSTATGERSTRQDRVAGLLGTESALLFPTRDDGAAGPALRCWAERTGSPAVAMHHLAHPILHESGAVTSAAGLRPVVLHRGCAQLTAADIRGVAEHGRHGLRGTPAARGRLRASVVAGTGGTRRSRSGTATPSSTTDGARPVGSAPFYDRRAHGDRGDLFDSVYVALQVPRSAASARAWRSGPRSSSTRPRSWRHRYGGLPFQMWPASPPRDLAALDDTLPAAPGPHVAHAKTVAAALRLRPGRAHVHPAQPHAHQFQIRPARTPPNSWERLTLEFAAEPGSG